MIVLFIILIPIIFLILRTPNYVYDLSQNRSFNYFEIYSAKDLLLKTAECSSKIQIDDFLPAHIRIDTFPDKGWGLVTKVAFRKNDVIYREVPLALNGTAENL
jgi:hypothetical protein